MGDICGERVMEKLGDSVSIFGHGTLLQIAINDLLYRIVSKSSLNSSLTYEDYKYYITSGIDGRASMSSTVIEFNAIFSRRTILALI